jgi:tetratricopeptide (TPR) repeat protein
MTSTALLRTLSVALMGLWLAGCATTQDDPNTGSPAPGAAVQGQSSDGEALESVAAPEETYVEVDADTLYQLIVAELAGRRGRLDLAVENYLASAQRHLDAGLAERATRLAVYAQNAPEGLKAARLWSSLAPNNLGAAQVQGALLLRANKLDAAAAEFSRAVQLDKSTPDLAYGRLADLLSQEKDRRAALLVMRKVTERSNRSVDARFALASLASRAGKVDEANVELKALLAQHPDNERVNEYYARILQSQGKTKEARAWLEAFLDRNPESGAARMSYGRILVGEEQYTAALEQFEQVITVDPSNINGRYALAIVQMQLKQYDGAKASFQALIERGERRDAANYYLGQIAERAEDSDAAIESYARVARGEFLLNARIRAAGLLADRGEIDSARASLQGLRRIYRSESVRLYRAEAELLAKSDDLDGAINVYDQALERQPKNTKLQYARAMLAARADRVDELERDLRDILTREPNNADALNALGYTLADKTDRYAEALSFIERALKLKPEDHYVIDSMGWVLYRLGRFDESVAQLRRAWAIRQDADVAAHLGEVLWVLGRKDEAREVWNKALQETPDSDALTGTIRRLTQ